MNYQFLQIANFNGQEFAYVLDQANGRVLRLPVYDSSNVRFNPPAMQVHPTTDMSYSPPIPQNTAPSPQPEMVYPDKPVSIIPREFAGMGRMDGNTTGAQ